MDKPEVLPVDRIAAADLLDAISSLLDHNGIGQVADLIRDGEYDEHEATQAFTAFRHRISSQARPDGELVGRDNGLYKKLRAKLARVHPTTQCPDAPLRIELTYGEIARLSTAILALSSELPTPQPDTERAQIVAWLRSGKLTIPGAIVFDQDELDSWAEHFASQIERGHHLASLTPSKEGSASPTPRGEGE